MTKYPLLAIDFYKADHIRQYPANTTKVYANLTPRSSRLYTGTHKDSIVVFGLQMFILEYLIEAFNTYFFARTKSDVIDEYRQFMFSTLGPDSVTLLQFEALHDLGYLPLKIRALDEGELCPINVPCIVIENTHPGFYWLTNYIETILSSYLWGPMTNATIAFNYRTLIDQAAAETSDAPSFAMFQGHDFSARGLHGPESMYRDQISHLLSFAGTDTCLAIRGAHDFYQADYTKELVGTSVPATEHSVMMMGQQGNELATFKRLITELYPAGIVSIVSDTWNLWTVLTDYAAQLKDDILNRTPNSLGLAKVVFRPDSGNPVDIICGSPYYYGVVTDANTLTEAVHTVIAANKTQFTWNNKHYDIDHLSTPEDTIPPEWIGALECLWNVFGGTINSKGYKVLNPRVGLIYGDSITIPRLQAIFARMKAKGFASDNIVFGIGSYTYNYSTRDTFGFAIKATYGEVDHIGRNLQKDPITDSGVKKSATGKLAVVRDDHNQLTLVQNASDELIESDRNELKLVYEDGILKRRHTLSDIRSRLHPNFYGTN